MTGIGSDNGGDRHDSLRLTPEQAKNGGKVPYTDKGSSRSILITIPSGVSHGQMIRLKNGITGRALRAPGDLYLHVEISNPFFRKIRSFLKRRRIDRVSTFPGGKARP
jgi:DnaJ-class molecular chaperone